MATPRTHRRSTLLLIAAVVAAGGCADDGDTVTDPIDVAEVGVTAMGQADVLACDADRAVVEQAVESFTLLEGGPPADEAELVPDYLRETSELFDLTPDGAVVPAPGSAC